MKKTLFCCALLLAFFLSVELNAQNNSSLPIDPKTNLITYQEVVTQDGNRGELFNRAIEWINTQYKNPTDATKVRNPSTGIIDILHRIEISNNENGVKRSAGIVEYFLKLELKDGRYRYTLTNFTHRQASRFPIEKWMDKTDQLYNPVMDEYLTQVNTFSLQLIQSLKDGMMPKEVKKEETW